MPKTEKHTNKSFRTVTDTSGIPGIRSSATAIRKGSKYDEIAKARAAEPQIQDMPLESREGLGASKAGFEARLKAVGDKAVDDYNKKNRRGRYAQ